MVMPINDNRDSALQETLLSPSDAYGTAALLLVESLIHGLCETSTLSAAQAIDIAERAASVQSDQAEAADGEGASLWRSHALLLAITASLRTDDRDGHPASFPT